MKTKGVKSGREIVLYCGVSDNYKYLTCPLLITIGDFREEFTLFMSDDELHQDIPVKFKLGNRYQDYKNSHKAIFVNFQDFLKEANSLYNDK